MILEKLTVMVLLKGVGYTVAGVTAIVVALSAFGFKINTPGESLDAYKEVHAVQHVEIDSTIMSIDQNLTSQTTLLEAMAAGDCLDRTKEQLALQRLLPTCSRLGIQK